MAFHSWAYPGLAKGWSKIKKNLTVGIIIYTYIFIMYTHIHNKIVKMYRFAR